MYRLFETIRITEGIPQHTKWHELRMNRAQSEYAKNQPPYLLGTILKIPVEFSKGIVRCNVSYGSTILSVDYQPYRKRSIRTLKLIHCDDIDYHLKFSDRGQLGALFSQRGTCDEIIIVKEGWITDTSVSNIIFFNGNSWITPDTPLLRGTTRERLIAEGFLEERPIRPRDLNYFSGCKLINAMRIPEEEEIIPIESICA